MKKKSTLLIALVVALAILAAVYFLLRSGGDAEGEAAPTETPAATLSNLTADSVQKLELSSGGETLRFAKNGESWTADGLSGAPIDGDAVAAAVETLSSVSATKLVAEQAGDLALYGLADPVAQATLTDSNGEARTLLLGDENTTTGDYYAQLSGDSAIYMVSPSVYQAAAQKLGAFLSSDEFPSISSSDITALTLEKGEERLALSWREISSTYDPEQHWYQGDGSPVGESAASAILTAATSIAADGWADYNPSAEKLAEYGLDAPTMRLTIAYTEKETTGDAVADTSTVQGDLRTVTLLFGNPNDDDTAYAQVAGSNLVALVSGAGLDTLASRSFEADLSVQDICPIDMETVDAMTVQAGTGAYNVSIRRTETTDESGEIKTESVYTVNDNEVDYTDFYDVYQKIRDLGTAGAPPDGAAPGETLLTVDFVRNTTAFATARLTIAAYDTRTCLARMDDGPWALIDVRDAQAISEAFAGLLPQ